MKKKILITLCFLSLNFVLPNYNINNATFYDSNVSAMGLYQEVRIYDYYNCDAIWVTAVKNGVQCSGYIYHTHTQLTWSGLKYYYSGELRPGSYAPNSIPINTLK